MCQNCNVKEPCYCEKGICAAHNIKTQTRCSECGHFTWPSESRGKAETSR